MSTFSGNNSNLIFSLHIEDRLEIFRARKLARNTGQLICIRLKEIDDQVILYGVYVNTPDFVEEYDRNGGVWGYSQP